MENQIEIYKKEIREIQSNPETFRNLLEITFGGLEPKTALTAMLEGRMIGFTLENFFKKDVYAIPFKKGYSLVTSIDYARKIGQKSGVCGVSSPIYKEDANGRIITCEITVKKIVQGNIGDFTALVYFDEYYKEPYKSPKGYEIKSLWDTKPRTMIAKVAEMHALRKACPEELDKAYIEEEYQREKHLNENVIEGKLAEKEEEIKKWQVRLSESDSLESLKNSWASVPAEFKVELSELKDKLKKELTIIKQ